ncbi:collagen alpha-1(I) chain-like [Pipistrellus kuhlii]|uniref:collagen alpha-1(I) chain-like n=1 Tax=Pipistrellus kuhlii TaxID=59472 RepID=UPI001E2709C5|nr:collagen alpha-1(I) chain-like [Pipistrellus kuhlii]
MEPLAHGEDPPFQSGRSVPAGGDRLPRSPVLPESEDSPAVPTVAVGRSGLAGISKVQALATSRRPSPHNAWPPAAARGAPGRGRKCGPGPVALGPDGAAAGPTRPPASGPGCGARGTDGPARRTAGAPVLLPVASAQREAQRRRGPRGPEAPMPVERWQGLLLALSWRRWRCAG